MNERNVEALRDVVRRFSASDDAVRNPASDITDLIAKHLAAHGVLVPSVLTEDDCDNLLGAADDELCWNPAFAAMLESIAKGEESVESP